MSRRLRIVIFGGTAVVIAVVVTVAGFWLSGKSEKTARHAATRFAAALIHNDPTAAPPGAGDYVTGVRGYFGAVISARVIGAHNKHWGSSNNKRSLFLAELLLRTERGPAVIELELPDTGLFSERVSGIHELDPDDAPGLAARDRTLAAAYAARGGWPAAEFQLDKAATSTLPTAPPPTAESFVPTSGNTSQLGAATKQLRCIQRADGDVAKLQRCARP
jgi:hypothetical protein